MIEGNLKEGLPKLGLGKYLESGNPKVNIEIYTI
jgi:hypothetical protein